MSEIQQNRYDQLLRRVCDLKGPGSKVSWSLGDLMPTLDVENIPDDLQLLMGSKLCIGTVAFAAGGAGNFVQVFLANPADSGVIARLLSATAWSGTTATVVYGMTQNSSVAVGATAFTDSRVFGQGTTLGLQGANTFLSAGSTQFRQRMLANTNTNFGGGAVIAPAGRFSVSHEQANIGLEVSFAWLERAAQPSELNI